MTRLCIPRPAPSKPISVALCELAIAAGVAGQSLTLCFDGYPAPVLCQLWRYCTRYTGPSELHHVRTQADVGKLTDEPSAVRLVLAHAQRLRNATSWTIQMASATAQISATTVLGVMLCPRNSAVGIPPSADCQRPKRCWSVVVRIACPGPPIAGPSVGQTEPVVTQAVSPKSGSLAARQQAQSKKMAPY